MGPAQSGSCAWKPDNCHSSDKCDRHQSVPTHPQRDNANFEDSLLSCYHAERTKHASVVGTAVALTSILGLHDESFVAVLWSYKVMNYKKLETATPRRFHSKGCGRKEQRSMFLPRFRDYQGHAPYGESARRTDLFCCFSGHLV
jgi:DNA-binding PucR family transcriptional regulator